MKVVHLVSVDLSSGAGRAIEALNRGLNQLGCDSVIWNTTNSHLLNSRNSVRKANFFLWRITFELNRLLLPSKGSKFFSLDLFRWSNLRWVDLDFFDIIHVHWFNGGSLVLDDLAKHREKLVWTPRDMWILTGGCHYPLDCHEFVKNCRNCPEFSSFFRKYLVRNAYDRKAYNLLKLNPLVVAISPWFQNEILKKHKNLNVVHIPNSVQLKEFTCFSRNEARRALGLDSFSTYICFGVNNINDEYKGVSYFKDALKHLDSDIKLLTFGDENLVVTEREHYQFGFVQSREKLNLIMAAADVFVMSSIQETFGKTVVEAMASGTPVVCFENTGPASLIFGDHLGVVCKIMDGASLSESIDSCLSSRSRYNPESLNDFAVRNFSEEVFNLHD